MQALSTMFRAAVPVCAAAALAACSSSSDSPQGTGTMSLAITDAPADQVSRVQITFDRVELQPQGGQRVVVDFDEPVTIENLLALQGPVSEPLFEELEVPAGQYNFMRLFVIGGHPDSFVEDDEGEFGLFVPGSQPQAQNQNPRFLQLSSPFVVPVGGAADFTIDVELREALVDRKNSPVEPHYMIRPSLRLVDNAAVGHLTGEVDPLIASMPDCTSEGLGETTAAVYVYEGTEVVPGDVCRNDDDPEACPEDVVRPLTSAKVSSEDGVTFTYGVGFLLAGDYTAALTCDAPLDDPEADDRDSVGFKAQKQFTIEADTTTELDFDLEDVDQEDDEGEEEDEDEEDDNGEDVLNG